MVALPEVSPGVDMAGAVQKLLGYADQSLAKWDEMHGQFPTTEEELRKAMALRPLSEPTIFSLDGKAIPYGVRITTNASGPSFESVPPNAGTIVYAVSAEYKEYWLTITTLRNPIDGPVALEHIAGFEQEPIWVNQIANITTLAKAISLSSNESQQRQFLARVIGNLNPNER